MAAAAPVPSAAPLPPAAPPAPAAAPKQFQPHQFAEGGVRCLIAHHFEKHLAATKRATEDCTRWTDKLSLKNVAGDFVLGGFDANEIRKHYVTVCTQQPAQLTGNHGLIVWMTKTTQSSATTQAADSACGQSVEAVRADNRALEERLPHIQDATEKLEAANAKARALIQAISSQILRDRKLYTPVQAWTPIFFGVEPVTHDYAATLIQRLDQGAFNVPAAATVPPPQPPSSAPAAGTGQTPMAAAKPAGAPAAPSTVPAPAPVSPVPAPAPASTAAPAPVSAPAVVVVVPKAAPATTATPAVVAALAPTPASAPVVATPIVGGPVTAAASATAPGVPSVGAPQAMLAPFVHPHRNADEKHATGSPEQLASELNTLASQISGDVTKTSNGKLLLADLEAACQKHDSAFRAFADKSRDSNAEVRRAWISAQDALGMLKTELTIARSRTHTKGKTQYR